MGGILARAADAAQRLQTYSAVTNGYGSSFVTPGLVQGPFPQSQKERIPDSIRDDEER
jgi:hypothetical protein